MDENEIEIETEIKNPNAADRQLLNELKQAKMALRQFEGLDTKKYNELLAREEENARKAEEAKGEYDKLRVRDQAKYTGELKKMAERLEARDARYLQSAVTSIIQKNDGSATLLAPHIIPHLMVNEEGEVVVREDSNFSSVEEILENLRGNEDFAAAFKSKVANGTGSVKSTGAFSQMANPYDRSGGHFSLSKQAELEALNAPLAKQLRAAAQAKK